MEPDRVDREDLPEDAFVIAMVAAPLWSPIALTGKTIEIVRRACRENIAAMEPDRVDREDLGDAR